MRLTLNRPVLTRLAAVVILAAAAAGLVLLRPARPAEQIPKTEKDLVALSDSIDSGIDSLYRMFSIESGNIRKRDIPAPGTAIRRREHRVQVPQSFVPLLFNQKLNQLAEKFGGKAYGSENSKNGAVTLHTRIDEYITQSIAFKRMEEKTKKPQRTNKRK